ncbi:unannotated protein [freshwater metagenome]|jgi:hypothetical protein|uniref:Unannotated protein n=1 Tax=freshwater metagenome TaxID=449393 RepID=A0A6J7K113_9ZZZZ
MMSPRLRRIVTIAILFGMVAMVLVSGLSS